MIVKDIVVHYNTQTNEAIVEEISSSVSVEIPASKQEGRKSLGLIRTEITTNPLNSKFDTGLLDIGVEQPAVGIVLNRSTAGVDVKMEANIIDNFRSIRSDNPSIKIIGYLFTVA